MIKNQWQSSTYKRWLEVMTSTRSSACSKRTIGMSLKLQMHFSTQGLLSNRRPKTSMVIELQFNNKMISSLTILLFNSISNRCSKGLHSNQEGRDPNLKISNSLWRLRATIWTKIWKLAAINSICWMKTLRTKDKRRKTNKREALCLTCSLFWAVLPGGANQIWTITRSTDKQQGQLLRKMISIAGPR